MSDREILVRWLAFVAARLRWRARLRELGRVACALLALLFAWQLLAAVGVPSPVRYAILPLLILAALFITGWFAWRLGRSTTLEQAAVEADASAGLQDEIRSAHWFAAERAPEGQPRGRADALVDLLLARAARTAQRLDTRRLIPLRVPGSALAALALAAGTGGLFWLSPHSASSSAPMQAGAGQARIHALAGSVSDRIGRPEPRSVTAIAAEHARQESPAASQAMDAQVQADAPADRHAVEDADAAQDAKLAGQAALARDASAPARSTRPLGLSIGAWTQASIAEALQESYDEQRAPGQEPPSASLAAPSARMTREMREQIREERRKLGGTPAQGDVQYNPRMRALRRNSSAANEQVEAQGQAADAGAQDSVDGDAKGSPEGKARAGGTSGEHPESSEVSEIDTQPVLGERTAPLKLQLEHARVDRADELQQGAARESFYAATRRRAAQAGYQAVDARSSTQREEALAPGDTPLSYREAVKRYFLTQHATEQ
jgi:hypothetical protein